MRGADYWIKDRTLVEGNSRNGITIRLDFCQWPGKRNLGYIMRTQPFTIDVRVAAVPRSRGIAIYAAVYLNSANDGAQHKTNDRVRGFV
jgi:hypothetical protein